MSYVCKFCLARKWKDEPAGLCCSSGKVRLSVLNDPSVPLLSLLLGRHKDSQRFLNHICSYNSIFQMTSFGGEVCNKGGYMPNFKVKGQVYHTIASLIPSDLSLIHI